MTDPTLEYADAIDLKNHFHPAAGAANLEAIVEAIQKDAGSRSFVANNPVPSTPSDRRLWIQAALTVRLDGDLPPQLVAQVDRLLQQELRAKSITDARKIPRLEGPYPFTDKVSIWDGDIVTLRVGAIVNAANAQLLGCFQPFHACIDNAIGNAAGPQLREDCARILAWQGYDEPTGKAKITRAYNLPSDYVLHTVGPIVPSHRPTAKQARELASCYASCLSLASKAGVRSVALCGISTGIFGYPADEAASIALKTLAHWLERNPDALEHVVFNTYGAAATETYREAARTWT